ALPATLFAHVILKRAKNCRPRQAAETCRLAACAPQKSSNTAATERRRDTPANARRSPRFRLPCLTDEKFDLGSSRSRGRSPDDVSPGVSSRTPVRRYPCYSSRMLAFASGILLRRRNRTQRGAPKRAPARSCAHVEQSAPQGLPQKFRRA